LPTKAASNGLLIHGTLLAWVDGAGSTRGDGLEMKIYILMMLIAVIVGLSHLPIRIRAKQSVPVPPDSLPA
jgi:hypothetical protein